MQLNEILEQDWTILLDSSTRPCEMNIGRDIYEANTYDRLDTREIKRAREALEEVERALRRDNVFTILEVDEEIKDLEEIIARKIRFLPPSVQLHKYNRVQKRRIKRQEQAEHDLKRLQDQAYKTYLMARRKALRFLGDDKRRYGALVEMIKTVDSLVRLKQDTGLYLGEHDEDRSRESDTDERLTAALFYLSVLSDKKIALLTGDGDIARLGAVVTKLIGSDVFLPYNEQFRSAVERNRFDVYIKRDGEFFPVLEKPKIEVYSGFNIYKANEEENEKAKQTIARLWLIFNGKANLSVETN